jgi:hypothetical protein
MRLLLPPEGLAIARVRAQARREHRSLSSVMGAAVRRYVEGLEGRRPAARFPDFARTEEAEPAGEDAPEFELTLDPKVWEKFEEEATRQGVTTEILATHAVLLYVTDRTPRHPDGPDQPALPPLPPANG